MLLPHRIYCLVSTRTFLTRMLGAEQDLLGPFVTRYNLKKGTYELMPTSVNYDYHLEIARSAYGDMLYDEERNEKYEAAISTCIEMLRTRQQEVNTLDIGAGTGLLSMLACRHNADKITACESFRPMYNIAIKTIGRNKMEEKIKILNKDSMKLTIGKGGDLESKANLLITEVFDTELIGERAITTYRHAVEHLMQPDSLCVPHSATVYVQVVECDLVRAWSTLRDHSYTYKRDGREVGLNLPGLEREAACPGVNSVWDVQLDPLIAAGQVKCLTKPVAVKRFVFGDLATLTLKSVMRDITEVTRTGQAHGLLFWWTLDMAGDGLNILSCEPSHINQNAKWRDHWMHAIYPIYPTRSLGSGDRISITTHQSEYSWYFQLESAEEIALPPERPIEPVCTCNLHLAYSRNRIGEINDEKRTLKYIKCMNGIMREGSVCVHIGDGSLLPFFAAQMGAEKIYCIEPELTSARCMESLAKGYELLDRVVVINKRVEEVTSADLDHKKIDVILTEPYFYASAFPWNNLFVPFAKDYLNPHLAESCHLLVERAVLKCVGVDFKHLWKIRAPVGPVRGFHMKDFDDVIQESIGVADERVEPHSTWEYDCDILTDVSVLHEFDLLSSESVEAFEEVDCNLNLTRYDEGGLCSINAVVLWMDYILCDGQTVINNGLLLADADVNTGVGGRPEWCRTSKQGIYFLPHHHLAASTSSVVNVKLYKKLFNNMKNFINFDASVTPRSS